MPLYRYQSLQHADSVRILTLHPSSNETDPIVCSILHAQLSDVTLEYKAVSYTWGDNLHRQTIQFRGSRSELQIGRNCYAVLRRLRQKHYDQLLWIDAICIDQENLKERASQVRLMNRIFSRAFSVRVFLGEETAGSRILFEELAEADKLLLQGAVCNRPHPSDAIIRELDELFQRAWFKRLWVLQEVSAKPSVVFMCGSSCASAQALRACIFGYGNQSRVTRQLCPLALNLIRTPPGDKGTPQLNLWRQIYHSRTCLATDPRDKVFALRSLLGVNQSKLDFLIDYTKSAEEIFIKTAAFLWPVLKMRMLVAVRHPHNKDMPSWCPDWSQNLPLSWDLLNYELDYWVPPDGNAFFREIEDGSWFKTRGRKEGPPELHAKGARYAQIVHKSENFSFKDLDDAQRQMREIYQEVVAFRRHSLLDVENGPMASGQLGQQILEAAMLVKDDDFAFYFCKDFHSGNFSSWNEKMIDEEAVQNFYDSLQQCRVALLDNRKLCIVPDGTQNGDTVCVFAGSESLCILRPTCLGKWKLISGDCFIFENDDYWKAGSVSSFLCDMYLQDLGCELEDFLIQ